MQTVQGLFGETIHSNGSEAANDFLAIYASGCARHAAATQAWLEMLKAAGVKAAHPDDGWVDRQNNSVRFTYPQFDFQPQKGDLIALGWQDSWRLTRVTAVTPSLFKDASPTYAFEQVDKACLKVG